MFYFELFWFTFCYVKAFIRKKKKKKKKTEKLEKTSNLSTKHFLPYLLFALFWLHSLLTKLLAYLTTGARPYKFNCPNIAQHKTRTPFGAFILGKTHFSTALCFLQLLKMLWLYLKSHVLADTSNLDEIVRQVSVCNIHLSAHFGTS